MKNFINKLAFFLPLLLCIACGEDFLDVKRNANQVVPQTLEDYQSLLGQESIMNRTSLYLNFIGADEYTVKDNFISAIPLTQKWATNAYTWNSDIFESNDNSMDWDKTYERILYANIAKEVSKIEGSTDEKNKVVAQALFHRAWNYYQLAITFCHVYSPENSNTLLGLPLRDDYDINKNVERSSLEETYRFIERDLIEAEKLIGDKAVHDKFTVSKISIRTLLAKVYLEMEQYDDCLRYALLVLDDNVSLLDFNLLEGIANRVTFSDFLYGKGNPEVILHFWNTTTTIIANSRYDLSQTLVPLLSNRDLRKKAFLYTESDGRITFKGSYSGNVAYFTGLAVDEIYLIIAECYARFNDKLNASKYLNDLLIKRYEKHSFEPVDFSASSMEDMLTKIILERRIELCMRGTRWSDLKRYNKEIPFQSKLTRLVLEEEYQLLPNDPKYVWPIPPKEIKRTGLAQNDR